MRTNNVPFSKTLYSQVKLLSGRQQKTGCGGKLNCIMGVAGNTMKLIMHTQRLLKEL